MILLTEPFAIFFYVFHLNWRTHLQIIHARLQSFLWPDLWPLAHQQMRVTNVVTLEGFGQCHCNKSPLFLQTEMSCSLERWMCDDDSSDDSQSIITSFIQFKCHPHQESSMHHTRTTQFNNSVINYICTLPGITPICLPQNRSFYLRIIC